MASGENVKKPFKMVEIPVNNFKDVAVPYHLKLLAEHKSIVQKENHDISKMRSETVSIKRVTAQLKGLLYELDTLRAQVEDSDLDKFDMKTVSLRKGILQIINEYTELLKQVTATLPPSPKKQLSRGNSNESAEPSQLQLSKSIDELKLEQREKCLQDVEKLQTDVQDLHEVYGSLHQMVVEQKEDVNVVEENVEEAHVNVTAGARHIITASRLKASVYPVTGAIVGTCIGGPLGLIAGLKVGGIAALGCGLLGFMGGKVLKTKKIADTNLEVTHPDIQENNDNSKTKKEE